jgi:hypothetical protein
MINQLIALSREIGGFLYDRLSRNQSLIRGAMIGVDQYWLEAYKASLMNRLPFPLVDSERPYQSQLLYNQFVVDFGYRPGRWNEHCVAMGYQEDAEPIYFLVILREPEDVSTLDLPNQFERYPIVYEYWNPCVALSSTKDLFAQALKLKDLTESYIHKMLDSQSDYLSIGRKAPDTAGTLGGLLRCPYSKKLYMVSCAHVLGEELGTTVYSPGPYENRQSRSLGEVKFVQLSNADASDCNPNRFRNINNNNQFDSFEKSLDLAVAEVQNNHDALRRLQQVNQQVNVARHIRKIDSMSLHDEVFFYGKESHKVEAKIRFLGIWDEILINNKPVCFREIFILTSRPRAYLNTAICSPGDSGAWIISECGGISNWDGMLFAGDGSHAYCCFAEYIQKACRNSGVFPNGLALVP